MTTTPDLPRQIGRPRDPRLDEALIGATLELLADGGYGALTMEAVAARAGVGKATLYRRWPGKEQLVVDAIATLVEPPDTQPDAAVREQLVALLESLRRKSRSSLAGKIFPRLVGESADNPELMRRYRAQVLDPRREKFREVLGRGIAEGVLRADADTDYAIDLFVGPMVYRSLLRNDPRPSPQLAERIVDDLMLALAPRSCGCGDAPTPTPTHDGTTQQEDA